VTLIDPRFREGRALKYGSAAASPYDDTVFIDADCFVLGSLEHLWEACPHEDMVMLGELLTDRDDENHHGFSTRALMRRFGLERYMKTNSGVFRFRRRPALEIMEACLSCYRNEVKPALRGSLLLGRWIGDEIAFGIVGGRRRLGAFPPPAPMYWPQEFGSLDLDRPRKPLLHFIWPPEPAVLDRLMGEAAARRRALALPLTGERAWMREVRALRAMARRRRVFERLRIWKTRAGA